MSASRSEISDVSPPAFSGATLDRVSTLRGDPDWIMQRLHEPTARVVAACRDGVLVRDAPEPTLMRRALDADTRRSIELAGPILLGLEDGAAIFAIDLDDLDTRGRARFTDGARVAALRDAGAMLSQAEGGLAAYLTALTNWHRTHRFCANCGAGTGVAEAGYTRRCPECGVVHFPRTDPVVIMLVENGARALLGRRAGWPHSRYSVLAGFVSSGESLEEAVAREVREESGIVAYDPSFVASQPWPFPASLMMGFEARSDGGQPRARDGELEDVQWFTHDTVRAAMTDPGPRLHLPPSVSIARFLIERWVARNGADL
jgi:NAD+ diphosphatase